MRIEEMGCVNDGRCRCKCHTNANVHHMVACCSGPPDFKDNRDILTVLREVENREAVADTNTDEAQT